MSYLTAAQAAAADSMCKPAYSSFREACIANNCNNARFEAMAFVAVTAGLSELLALSRSDRAALSEYHEAPEGRAGFPKVVLRDIKGRVVDALERIHFVHVEAVRIYVERA